MSDRQPLWYYPLMFTAAAVGAAITVAVFGWIIDTWSMLGVPDVQ